jgi:phthiocerol/phenolphthiocerol synthesis type-I polyketide synthase E
MHEPMPSHAIAIVGLAGRFPQADDLETFWRQIADGVESLATLSDAELDAAGVPVALRTHPHYVRRGTVEQAEYFDAAFFGYSPREAQVMDPQQRVFLECSWQALEHAGYAPGDLGDAVGVYAGASMNSYVYSHLLRNPALAEAVGGYQIMLGNDKDFLCTRVSYKLGLRGPSITVQTACSTSLVAVQVACRALQRGECDMALAGGVSFTFPLGAGYLYQEGMILSPDGHCRPFDVNARGTRAGAGAGVVVLKRLADALADGDTVHAVIRGIAVNNDGAGKAGYTAPSVEGQVEVIATAQALAGVSARSIGYVEAHGTATPLGDPIEIAALTQAFRATTDDVGFCRLGSLKANLGHLDAAAGVAGLIKAVLVLQQRQLPPLVNFTAPNPALDLARSPFIASATGAPWATDGHTPRRAAVSSFGIGGTNAHAVVEEAPEPEPMPTRQAEHLLVLSARTATALDAACARLVDHLQAHPEQALVDVAYTLQVGRPASIHRRALVVQTAAQAVAALRDPQRAPVCSAHHEGGARPVAFLFSGQGSQHAGMGRGLYDTEAVYREAIDRCAQILQPLLGEDLRTRLFAADGGAALAQTRLTQPALFATEYALATLWQHWGVVPRAMLGHSIGEYVAAHLAGVMSLDDALAVVAARGELMQQQAAGTMAAVHLGADALQPWLADGVEIAAVNAPTLCAVSGPKAGIDSLLARLAAAGIDARALHTSHAFHSAMMTPALAPFTAVLERVTLHAPTRPYISNLSGTWITPQQATSPAYYAEHLRRAVQFEAGMRTLAADAALHFVEVGPATALTSLVRLNLGADGARRVVASMRRPTDGRADREALLDAAGRLWLAGATITWPAVHGEPRRRVPLPTYPFERKRHTVEPTVAAATAPATATDAVRRSSRPDDWFYAPTWTRDDSAAGSVDGPWLVLGDGGALTRTVCAALLARGAASAVAVEHSSACTRVAPSLWRVRPTHLGDDLAQLLRDTAPGQKPRHALNLWGLPGTQALPADAPGAYDVLVALSAALATGADARVLHCTAGAESVLDEPVFHAHAALATGPVLVLPLEMPGLQMRSIDLDGRGGAWHDAASVIAAEAALTAPEPQVARRGERRWVRRYERLALPPTDPAALPLRHEGRYLITGGLGGMALSMARWLAREYRARLLLTARSPLPPREAWDAWLQSHATDERHAQAISAIRQIEADGGDVIVAAADAADAQAMAAAVVAATQRFGGLDGVIHAAGVSGRGSVALRLSTDDTRAVFAPKVQGLRVLIELLGATRLDFVALMSSINAAVGSAGACDYTSANAVLDAFADSAERPPAWQRVVSIAWGAWRDVGMAAKLQVADALRSHWQAHLAGAIVPADGVQAFARALASGRSRIVVDTYDLVRRNELLRQPRPPADAQAAAPASSPPPGDKRESPITRANGAAAAVAPGSEIEHRLAAIWGELLGIDGIGIHDDFFELGGHSLMATRVLSRIDETLGVRLALRDVFDAPTVHQLGARVAAASTTRQAAPTADDREELEF